MKYVALKPNYILRGWQDKPYALYDLDRLALSSAKTTELTKTQMEAIELAATKGVDLDGPLIPRALRRAADYLVEKGIFELADAERGLEDYQKYHYTEAKQSLIATLSITGNCNLRCRHCCVSADGNPYGEMSLEQLDEVIRQLLEANIHSVALSGGEPLVHPQFWTFIDHLCENHIMVDQFFTNGVSVTDAFLDRMEAKGVRPHWYLVSFDGVGCHDWMRGVPGTEERTIAAIRRLRKRGYKVLMVSVLHNGNIDSLPATYELVKELGADWRVSTVRDTGNWLLEKHPPLDLDHLLEVEMDLLRRYKEEGQPIPIELSGIFRCDGPGKPYKVMLLSGTGTEKQREEVMCTMTQRTVHLLANGKLLPCLPMSGTVMEDIAPNIFDEGQSMAKILSHSIFEWFTHLTYDDYYRQNPECNSCEQQYKCQRCPAGALAGKKLSCKSEHPTEEELKHDPVFLCKDEEMCGLSRSGCAEKIRAIMEE